MPKKTGIWTLTFGVRGQTPEEKYKFEPNPCNVRLGLETERVMERYPDHVVSTEWEVAKWLVRDGVQPDHVFDHREEPDRYFGTEGVWDETKELFKANDVTDVVVVAQPWMRLHLWKARRLARKDGFNVLKVKINPIGFDNSELNSQPWTKSGGALLIYAIKQGFAGVRQRLRRKPRKHQQQPA